MMTQNINELKKQIVEKNLVLDAMGRSDKHNRDEIKIIKAELDKLLYKYYKLYKFC